MSYGDRPGSSAPKARFDTVALSNDRSALTLRDFEDERASARHGHASPGSSRSVSIEPTGLSPGGPHASESPGQLDKPRMRISKACTPCRKVKLKCNGGNPCERCSTLSLPVAECTYPPSLRGKTRRKKAEIEAERRAKQANGGTGSASRGRSAKSDTGIPRSQSFVEGQSRFPRSQESTRWDSGWTMRQMKDDFAKWKYDESLVESGPRNEHLWHNPAEPSTTGTAAHQAKSGSRSSNAHFISPSSLGLDDNHIPDRYTTLPFPGDAHNPLGVLAEASASAGNVGTKDVPSPSPFQPTGGPGSPSNDGPVDDEHAEGYYIPLERVLKKDAPHIMSLISVHE